MPRIMIIAFSLIALVLILRYVSAKVERSGRGHFPPPESDPGQQIRERVLRSVEEAMQNAPVSGQVKRTESFEYRQSPNRRTWKHSVSTEHSFRSSFVTPHPTAKPLAEVSGLSALKGKGCDELIERVKTLRAQQWEPLDHERTLRLERELTELLSRPLPLSEQARAVDEQHRSQSLAMLTREAERLEAVYDRRLLSGSDTQARYLRDALGESELDLN